MVKVGDLVKRIAVLSFMNGEFGWVLTDEFPDDVGIVIDVEEPMYGPSTDSVGDILDTGCFIKVLWQKTAYGGPVWHRSEEILVINEINS
jgi:hypothetical protein